MAEAQADDHNQRSDRVHVRHEEDNGEECECSANDTAANPEHTLVQGRTRGFQGNESAGDECGVDSRPVNGHIKDVTKHRRESDFEREVHVCRIGKRVGCEKTFRFRRLCNRARFLGQK